ncbi:MAG: chemotaxis protein CheW [Magnetococcales bacterium]|nr:chemotaxis protein CheW [Magnetococcales bacterium]MBF0114223.1 chemotaxis protein CheW [Magnetococcales bacterium]
MMGLRLMAGGQPFLIDAEAVQEILMVAELHPLPQSHPALIGLLALHGESIPVLDLGLLLGLHGAGVAAVDAEGDFTDYAIGSRILLLAALGGRYGLIVEQVQGFFGVEAEAIRTMEHAALFAPCCSGVWHSGEGPLPVLSSDALLRWLAAAAPPSGG